MGEKKEGKKSFSEWATQVCTDLPNFALLGVPSILYLFQNVPLEEQFARLPPIEAGNGPWVSGVNSPFFTVKKPISSASLSPA